MDPSLVAFTVISFMLAITPGADMALVTRNTVARGRAAALFTTAGICTACAVHAVASSLGLSAILAQSAMAYSAVKFVGAIYLVWLGLRSILGAQAAATKESCESSQPTAGTLRGGTARRSFVEGALTNLLNPKVALFYLMVLPQFILAGQSVLARSLLLASIHIGIGAAWLCIYVSFIHQARTVLTRPAVKAWVERITGGVMIALGLRLAVERRT